MQEKNSLCSKFFPNIYYAPVMANILVFSIILAVNYERIVLYRFIKVAF